MIIHGIDLSQHYIILDANALMDQVFHRFLRTSLVESYNETLQKKKKKDFRIFIPEAVLIELDTISKRPGSDNLQKRADAMEGLQLANNLVKAGYVEIMRSDYTGTIGGFNDVSLLSIFVELRRHTHVALLTNDRGLATDTLNLNLLKSVKSSFQMKAVFVDRQSGQLKSWLLDPTLREAKRFASEVLKR